MTGDKLPVKTRLQAFIPLPKSKATLCKQHVYDRICLHAADCDLDSRSRFNDAWSTFFSIDGVLHYQGFCDDFGPMSLGTTYDFYKLLDKHLDENPAHSVVLQSKLEGRALTNAVFLLGSYLLIKYSTLRPDAVLALFRLVQHLLLSCRDVSPGEQNFHLHLRDCWGGLWRLSPRACLAWRNELGR